MAYELKEGGGGIFKNTSKIPGDNLPDYNGTGMIHGKEVNISLWVKDGKNGSKFFSLSIKDKQPKPQQPTAPDPFEAKVVDNDLPF